MGAEILTLNKSTACFQNTVQNVYLIAADFKRIGMTIQFKIVHDVFYTPCNAGNNIRRKHIAYKRSHFLGRDYPDSGEKTVINIFHGITLCKLVTEHYLVYLRSVKQPFGLI